MIEIQARLPRGSIYLAGESIKCVVNFRNPLPTSQKRVNSNQRSIDSNNDAGENLAWASVQIHCHCSVDETKVLFPYTSNVTQEEIATASEDTSFIPSRGERGHVVLSTKPKILFCDLRLMPGESRSFIYKDNIPSNCPPSFRGQSVRYAYKLTIGTQRVNTAIKLLRIPIRIFVLSGLSEMSPYNGSEDYQVTPSNPFLQTQQKDSPLDLALQLLGFATARRTPSFYNITNQHGRVVRFCLLKSAYRLGEDILGTFDFTNAAVSCVQFSVTLQSEEEIDADCCKQGSKHGPTNVAYSKYHEFCLHLKHTQMLVPIPLTVTPAFNTDIVSLRWKLHFEFVTTTAEVKDVHLSTGEGASEGITCQGAAYLDIQTMVWDLPIKVYPTHPLQVAQGLQCQTASSIVI